MKTYRAELYVQRQKILTPFNFATLTNLAIFTIKSKHYLLNRTSYSLPHLYKRDLIHTKNNPTSTFRRAPQSFPHSHPPNTIFTLPPTIPTYNTSYFYLTLHTPTSTSSYTSSYISSNSSYTPVVASAAVVVVLPGTEVGTEEGTEEGIEGTPSELSKRQAMVCSNESSRVRVVYV